MYVLDEPSIGLHQRDNERLIGTLRRLRDLGNSVLVVEHDEDMIRAADHVIDMGPGAGVHGGRVISEGTPDEVAADPQSLTGRYLAHTLRIEVPRQRHVWTAAPETAAPPAMAPPRTSGSAAKSPAWPRFTAPAANCLRLINARGNNLKGVTAEIPVGLLTCVTGVSGSGSRRPVR